MLNYYCPHCIQIKKDVKLNDKIDLILQPNRAKLQQKPARVGIILECATCGYMWQK